MCPRIYPVAALVVALVAVPSIALRSAHAGGPSATDAIRAANDRLRSLLDKPAIASTEEGRGRARQVTRELRGLLDIGTLAERALVDHWSKMSVSQRAAVVDTLQLLVEESYVVQLRGGLRYEISYLGEEPRGEDVVVKTLVTTQRKGRKVELAIDYALRPSKDQTWRVYDLITDGVSLRDNYRAQFNRIIAKEGVDGLLKRMKTKLEKVRSGKVATPAPR